MHEASATDNRRNQNIKAPFHRYLIGARVNSAESFQTRRGTETLPRLSTPNVTQDEGSRENDVKVKNYTIHQTPASELFSLLCVLESKGKVGKRITQACRTKHQVHLCFPHERVRIFGTGTIEHPGGRPFRDGGDTNMLYTTPPSLEGFFRGKLAFDSILCYGPCPRSSSIMLPHL